MSDIVKGALGGAWALVVGWLLPTAAAMAVFGVVVLPSLDSVRPFDALDATSAANQAAVLLVAAVLTGWVLSCVQTPLYRVLEGYLGWPRALVVARIHHHQKVYDELRKELVGVGDGLQQAFVLERFTRYPAKMAQVAPTRLGNAIRRFEYYGADRYQLDSQTLWAQLRASIPESLAKDIDVARAAVDFFVCSLYLSALLGLTAIVSISADTSRWLVQLAVTCLAAATMWVSYRSAVIATDGWAAGVRAMVDVGRLPLAHSMGLVIPAQLEDERRMWKIVGDFSIFPYNGKLAQDLDEFRAIPNGSETMRPDRTSAS